MAFYYLKICLALLLGFVATFFLLDRFDVGFGIVVTIGLLFVFAVGFFSAKGLWIGIGSIRETNNYNLAIILPTIFNAIFFLGSLYILLSLVLGLIRS